MPSVIRKTIDPLFKMADIAISTVLISIENDKERFKELVKQNKLFVIEFNKFLEED
jgi:hypothetical protein